MSNQSQPELSDRPKILLVRFSALGDVVQTLSVLPVIRRKYPNAFIGWAIDTEFVQAIEGHAQLDRIHACHRRRWIKSARNIKEWAKISDEVEEFVNEVRNEKYDVALDVQGLFRSALLTAISGAPRKIGFAHGREMSNFFYGEKFIDREAYFDNRVLHVEHMAELTSLIGCAVAEPEISLPPPTEATKESVMRMLSDFCSLSDQIVAVAPATQWESKQWPDRHWAVLIERILRQTNLKLVVVGGPGDSPAVAQILSRLDIQTRRLLNLTGKTSIRELYHLFSKVQAVIACDSAPLHIAGAAHVPNLIGIYGPTATGRTGPIGSPNIRLYTTEGQLKCQPCHSKVCPIKTGECLTRIYPDDVFTGLLEAMPHAKTNIPVAF